MTICFVSVLQKATQSQVVWYVQFDRSSLCLVAYSANTMREMAPERELSLICLLGPHWPTSIGSVFSLLLYQLPMLSCKDKMRLSPPYTPLTYISGPLSS